MPLEAIATDELSKFQSATFMSGSQDVTVRAIAWNARPRLAAGAPAAPTSCFDPARAAQGPAQKSHRGIALRGIPDAARSAAVERWIDGMTAALHGSDHGMLLRSDALAKPATFFHEASHPLDGERGWRDSRAWGERFMRLPVQSASFPAAALGHLLQSGRSAQPRTRRGPALRVRDLVSVEDAEMRGSAT